MDRSFEQPDVRRRLYFGDVGFATDGADKHSGPGQLADESFLEQLASVARKITLANGEKQIQDLQLTGR